MGVLMMLLTIGGLLAAAILLLLSFWKKLAWMRKFVLGAMVVWFGLYTAALLGFSLTSEEKVLGLNEPKEFCGFYLDCHMHASVLDVRRAKTFGALKAKDEFHIVKVKVFSDAKRATLNMIQPEFVITDSQGRKFEPSEDLSVTIQTPPFEEKIPAGGSIEGEVAFDIPADAKDLKLSITEGYGIDKYIEAVLIDDEDSIFHKPTVFKVETGQVTASN